MVKHKGESIGIVIFGVSAIVIAIGLACIVMFFAMQSGGQVEAQRAENRQLAYELSQIRDDIRRNQEIADAKHEAAMSKYESYRQMADWALAMANARKDQDRSNLAVPIVASIYDAKPLEDDGAKPLAAEEQKRLENEAKRLAAEERTRLAEERKRLVEETRRMFAQVEASKKERRYLRDRRDILLPHELPYYWRYGRKIYYW
jgi:signal transduction histidine kinase